ncbi:hypothetical protein ACLMJK_001308 [Lecanora helva]
MSNRFYFSDSDTDSDSSTSALPFPKPLPRSAFLTPDFSPTTFLSSLRNRHQTLEDLRSELRTRSQDLNKELLDLVNENYQDFLSLGSSLKGGDERVEEVRLGLMGFGKEVEGLRGKVEERKGEVEGLVRERRRIRGEIWLGRRLLEVEQRIGELEVRLMLVEKGARNRDGEEEVDSESEEESGEEGEGSGLSVSRLRRHVEQYLLISQSVERIGKDHPFLVKQDERVLRLKNTVLLDLNNALKQAVSNGENGGDDLLKLLMVYKQMDQGDEAISVLKELKSKKL